MPGTTADLAVYNYGTLFLLEPLTPTGKAWIADNLPIDAMTYGYATVIEPRFIVDIVAGAQADGLKVE